VKVKDIGSEPLPNWVDPSLQGLAFWLGYKTNLYPHYPLTEGAIVGELASLISAHLDSGMKLECEAMYKDLHSKNMGNLRADLIIRQNSSDPHVIEVKRYTASDKLIQKDIKRLGELKESFPCTRCFLIITSQSEKPAKYLTEKTNAVRSNVWKEKTFKSTSEIPKNLCAKVRRVCKASSSFNLKTSSAAHYAIIIEVTLK